MLIKFYKDKIDSCGCPGVFFYAFNYGLQIADLPCR